MFFGTLAGETAENHVRFGRESGAGQVKVAKWMWFFLPTAKGGGESGMRGTKRTRFLELWHVKLPKTTSVSVGTGPGIGGEDRDRSFLV